MRKLLIVAIAVLASGCGTIVNGPRQGIAVTSSPSGAECEIEGKKYKTPAIVKISRRRGHTINCELEGFDAGGAAVTRRGSGWVFGNIMLGGPIGLLVDWASGGLFALEPSQVNVALSRKP